MFRGKLTLKVFQFTIWRTNEKVINKILNLLLILERQLKFGD